MDYLDQFLIYVWNNEDPQLDLDCYDERDKYIKEFQDSLKIFSNELQKAI